MAGLLVGIGLRPATAAEVIDRALLAVLDELAERTVTCFATIDRRAGEPGLRTVARARDASVIGYSAAELAAVTGVARSPRTTAAVGTGSVAEAAALRASADGSLLIPRRVVHGLVLAIARG